MKATLVPGSLALAAALVVAAAVPAVLAADDAPAAKTAPADPRDVAKRIDAAIEASWKEAGVRPNRACSDEEFVRRVHLDIVGALPTALQVEDFLKDASPAKREQLVETLLATPGYARHFANLWGEVLVGVGTGDNDRDFVPGIFLPWLERQFASERPYGEIVTELITAQGTPYASPPVNFLSRLDTNPTDLAGVVSRAFLGVQIQCAQCHDHPYEDIRQTEFQGMTAFFGRIRLRPAEIPYEMFGPRGVEREREKTERTVQELMKNGMSEPEARLRAEQQKPKTREITDLPGGVRLPKAYAEGRQRFLGEASKAEPIFLKGGGYTDVASETRRQALARWVSDPANPYTARALANRTWGWFLGRGFVHPVDDFQSANPAAVPAALDLLAKDTAASGFDLKRLVRIVTATRAYQTSTAAKERPEQAVRLFAAGPLKPLTPQQSFDSLNVSLGVVPDARTLSLDGSAPTAIEMDGGRGAMRPMSAAGATSADGADATPDRVQLAMTQAARTFFRTFGDDEGNGDSSFEGTVPQGLFLLNSQVVNGMLANPRVSVIPKVMERHPTEKERVRHLFLRTLSREPTEAESKRFVEHVRAGAPRDADTPRGRGKRFRSGEDPSAAPYADVLWVLVSSSEFGTNH